MDDRIASTVNLFLFVTNVSYEMGYCIPANGKKDCLGSRSCSPLCIVLVKKKREQTFYANWSLFSSLVDGDLCMRVENSSFRG